MTIALLMVKKMMGVMVIMAAMSAVSWVAGTGDDEGDDGNGGDDGGESDGGDTGCLTAMATATDADGIKMAATVRQTLDNIYGGVNA